MNSQPNSQPNSQSNSQSNLQERLEELQKDLELASSCQEIAYFEREIYHLECYLTSTEVSK